VRLAHTLMPPAVDSGATRVALFTLTFNDRRDGSAPGRGATRRPHPLSRRWRALKRNLFSGAPAHGRGLLAVLGEGLSAHKSSCWPYLNA